MPKDGTKIFLDGGDPDETVQIKDLLGFVDGQTTNPSLIAKNPEAQARIERGERFTERELLDFYRDVVRKTSELVPRHGSVSIEVYADAKTPAEQMVEQGREMNTWIPNAHIKLPIIPEGLKAAECLVKDGIRVNLTLCFSQEQAAAVHAATRGAQPGQVFVSPFVGRLDDNGYNGMDVVTNIHHMFRDADSHVQLLAASLRSLEHLYACLQLGVDLVTVPFKVLKEWGQFGAPNPPEFTYRPGDLARIPNQVHDLNRGWREFLIKHPQTDQGLAKFAADWQSLLK